LGTSNEAGSSGVGDSETANDLDDSTDDFPPYNCDGGGVKAGVDIVQKSVVQFDNLYVDCTPALHTDYLLANEIPVLSCYKSKSWLPTDDREKVTAFCVCVNARDHGRIKDASLWSKGIVIRDWVLRQNGSPNHGEH